MDISFQLDGGGVVLKTEEHGYWILFNFVRSCEVVFQSCTILHLKQQ